MMAMLSFKGYSQSKTPQEKIRILKNGYIIQLTSDNASVKKGSLVIEGDKIKEILYEEVSEIADADIIEYTREICVTRIGRCSCSFSHSS